MSTNDTDEAAAVVRGLRMQALALRDFADLIDTSITGPLSPRLIAGMARTMALGAEEAASELTAPMPGEACPPDAGDEFGDECGEPACACHSLAADQAAAAEPDDEDGADEDLAAIEDLIRDIRYRRRKAART